ncbi:hypothetical protein E8F11_00520, partial [Pseudomonas sp. BN417]|nr:hypothetical protein [Pseudomonas sp. BN417]
MNWLCLHYGLRVPVSPPGESLLAVAPEVTKKACPCIRPRLRRGLLAPSLLRGPGVRGHPWPRTPL